ncbi:hypothetical protein DOE73_00910 [Paenibacillus dendritiformis]|nr:hypothetical protein DOE73_00910 [Paenibacillus dendritiformis]
MDPSFILPSLVLHLMDSLPLKDIGFLLMDYETERKWEGPFDTREEAKRFMNLIWEEELNKYLENFAITVLLVLDGIAFCQFAASQIGTK